MNSKHQVLIVGAGTAGLSVAARLAAASPSLDIALIEPSEWHYYQPLWTLVGGGVFDRETTRRPQAEYIPPSVRWIRDAVNEFDPIARTVTCASGAVYGYEQLVVAPGIQLDWGKIDGALDAMGRDGVCSNYAYEHVPKTWEFLRGFTGGNAVFTFPSTPIKCAGAPQKIMYLADDHLRRTGVRERSKVIYASAQAGIFGVKKYAQALSKVIERKQIETHFRRDLVAIRRKSKEAVFRQLDGGEELVLKYDLLHVVPPQSAP